MSKQNRKEDTFTVSKILKIFGTEVSNTAFAKAAAKGTIPTPERIGDGAITRREWRLEDIPLIGEKYGFLNTKVAPTSIAIFTTKGGVLKTTLALNLARLAALHNVKTCIVGLDVQGDISATLGHQLNLDECESLDAAISEINKVKGLLHLLQGKATVDEIIMDTDLPTLKFIPETPELVAVEQLLSNKTRREYWLRENVIDPLKGKFDLVIMDCSPNWNRLVTNALASCDILISPLECKINNFRNYDVFKTLIDGFFNEMKITPKHILVPTKLSSTRKLSSEIRAWYLSNVKGCTNGAIRELASGEESVAKNRSLPEYAPTSLAAQEMREIISEIWNAIQVRETTNFKSKPIKNDVSPSL